MEVGWCFWHPAEAPFTPGDFQGCGECGHVFRTEDELLAEHKTHFTDAEWAAADAQARATIYYFCPLCIHDF